VTATITTEPSDNGFWIAASDTAIWTLNGQTGYITRIDPSTNKVVASISGQPGFGDIAIEAGNVWVLNHDNHTISRIDARTNRIATTITFPPPVGYLSASSDAVWVASYAINVVRKLDPRTNRVVATLPVDGGPTNMAIGSDALWICNHGSTQYGVTRIDPQTNKVLAQIDIGSDPGYRCDGIGASSGAVWAVLLDDTAANGQGADVALARVDPATNRTVARVTLPTARDGYLVTADERNVWAVSPDYGLYRIDPSSNRIVEELYAPGSYSVALGAGSVWVTDGQTGAVLRINLAAL
jgi:streptogramin lyase